MQCRFSAVPSNLKCRFSAVPSNLNGGLSKSMTVLALGVFFVLNIASASRQASKSSACVLGPGGRSQLAAIAAAKLRNFLNIEM